MAPLPCFWLLARWPFKPYRDLRLAHLAHLQTSNRQNHFCILLDRSLSHTQHLSGTPTSDFYCWISSWHISLDISIDGDAVSSSEIRIARGACPPEHAPRKLTRSTASRFVRYGASNFDQAESNQQKNGVSIQVVTSIDVDFSTHLLI